MTLPPRIDGTMADAIALSSPNGHMSKRARKAAQERLRIKLFGVDGLQMKTLPVQPTELEYKTRKAREYRELAKHGMQPRKFNRLAEQLEKEIALLKI